MFKKLRKYQFLFEELVKRDFKKKIQTDSFGNGMEYTFSIINSVGYEAGIYSIFWT